MSNPERRHHRRQKQHLPLRYRTLNHEFAEGHIHDLSRDGARVSIDRIGDGPLILEVKIKREWVRLIGHPVWARHQETGTLIGIKFFNTVSSIKRKLDAWAVGGLEF